MHKVFLRNILLVSEEDRVRAQVSEGIRFRALVSEEGRFRAQCLREVGLGLKQRFDIG